METVKTYLTIRIGREYFAIEVSCVNNIMEYTTSFTKLPEMPVAMLGIINLRDQVLPVIDLRLQIGILNVEITTDTCILVTEVKIEREKILLGMLVDAVIEVIEVNDEQIKAPPGISKTKRNRYITGIFHQNDQFVMILNINKVLDVDDFSFSDELLSISYENEKNSI